MANYELRPFKTPEELAEVAALAWLEALQGLRRGTDPLVVALSGGRISQPFYRAIVRRAEGFGAVLEQVHYFWADERCLGPEDPESNFHGANELLFKPLQVPPARIHRIRGELPPAEAANLASEELRSVLKDGAPLDLVFLGLGEDGHTASLFPGDAGRPGSVYRHVLGPKPPPNRITLDFAPLIAARRVIALTLGKGKEEALAASLRSRTPPPFGQVVQQRSETLILSDIALEPTGPL